MRREQEIDMPSVAKSDGGYQVKRIQRLHDGRHGSGCGVKNGFCQPDPPDASFCSFQSLHRRGDVFVAEGGFEAQSIDYSPTFHSEEFTGIRCLPSSPIRQRMRLIQQGAENNARIEVNDHRSPLDSRSNLSMLILFFGRTPLSFFKSDAPEAGLSNPSQSPPNSRHCTRH
jgi:hypothetical protein